jgi:hypothetical protein
MRDDIKVRPLQKGDYIVFVIFWMVLLTILYGLIYIVYKIGGHTPTPMEVIKTEIGILLFFGIIGLILTPILYSWWNKKIF